MFNKGALLVILFLFLSSEIFLFSCAEKQKTEEPALGTHGMVSSAHPLATKAGIDILKKGGNAFDAAVAVASVLNVVEPMMSGIGGYGTILIYDAKKREIRFLNSSGRIPAGLSPDVFRPPDLHYLENRRGPAAVSTPGNVNAWEAMSQTYGDLKWPDLFEAAIDLSEQGFALDEATAGMIEEAFVDFPEQAKAIYGKNGKPLAKGESLVQKSLANSFRLIAREGAGAVYGGSLGQAIASEMKRTEGYLTIDDLLDNKAEWWTPIHVTYRGYEVYTASPPATAFPSLIRLGLMSQFGVSQMGHNSAETLHRFIEVTKHAFWCRLRFAGDPDVNPPPLDILFSENYWKEQASSIDPNKAKPFVYPGLEEKESSNTTHFVVADSSGNIVSATQTLGNLFGSRIMPETTGIWLNNSLAYCTFEPKGNPMDAHPGRRKLSGDCPTIVVRNGKPWVAIGTPGGHTIGQTIPQMVMNIIDFGLNIQQAVAAARVSFIEPDTIAVEEGISKAVWEKLEKLGHKLRLIKKPGGLGNAHGLTIEYGKDGKPARFSGASDPRGKGLAQGY